MLFSGVFALAAYLIVRTGEGEGIFKQPTKKNGDKPDAAGTVAMGGVDAAAPAANSGVALDAVGTDAAEPPASYPSAAASTSGGYPSTAAPAAAGGAIANNRARTAGNALIGSLSGLVSRGVSKLTDGLHELAEARAAGRKVYNVLHPQTVKMERIAMLLNWRVPYNTWLVVTALVVTAIVGKLLPWWQCDLLLKMAFGYLFFVPGFLRWYRGRSGQIGPVDAFWLRLPHAATPREPQVETAASVAARSARAVGTARQRAEAARQDAVTAAPVSSASSSPRATTASAAAESPPQHRKPVPARPPPPKIDDAVAAVADQTVEETPRAGSGGIEAILGDQEALGSWSAIHVNSKKKGTLQVLEKHVAILLPSASAPESVAVE